jgi:hypothetical protein
MALEAVKHVKLDSDVLATAQRSALTPSALTVSLFVPCSLCYCRRLIKDTKPPQQVAVEHLTALRSGGCICDLSGGHSCVRYCRKRNEECEDREMHGCLNRNKWSMRSTMLRVPGCGTSGCVDSLSFPATGRKFSKKQPVCKPRRSTCNPFSTSTTGVGQGLRKPRKDEPSAAVRTEISLTNGTHFCVE